MCSFDGCSDCRRHTCRTCVHFGWAPGICKVCNELSHYSPTRYCPQCGKRLVHSPDDLTAFKCLVLYPSRDRAAIAAIRAYIKATSDTKLAADLGEWLDGIEWNGGQPYACDCGGTAVLAKSHDEEGDLFYQVICQKCGKEGKSYFFVDGGSAAIRNWNLDHL